MFTLRFLSLFISLIAFSNALPQAAELLPLHNYWPKRQAATATRPVDPACTHGPSSRQCWTPPYSVNTNYDAVWPTTGKTVKYTLDVQNKTLAPDGFPRVVYAINGQYPGPTIRANWGDTLEITVTNSLTTNGTSMHWHGIRQWKTNSMDGTNGITECPLAPGKSRTYRFLCTQFGTTWFHSHYSDQYTDGVVGSIVIDGPASSNYDIDLGPFVISDWYHTPAFTIAPLLKSGALRGPPPADNILFNGKNVWNPPGTNGTNTTGEYQRTLLTKGKKHRLRIINTSTDSNFKVGLDGHNMTVMAADFVPLKPWTTEWLLVGIGQRYDIVIDASKAADNYWFHAIPQVGCSTNRIANAVSIFSYNGAPAGNPSNATRNRAPSTDNDCSDPNANLVPYVKLDVPTNGTLPEEARLDVGFGIIQNEINQTQVQWTLNETAIRTPWDKPTLQYVLEQNTSYPRNANIITLPRGNTWSYWVIQAIGTLAPPVAHPMHLHGHDFYVLGAGTGIFDGSQPLKYTNPPRRDVAMLPPSGWLVLALFVSLPFPSLRYFPLSTNKLKADTFIVSRTIRAPG
jgi:FtsP/CotA-like multicopper oxidase with cupredoxin domain